MPEEYTMFNIDLILNNRTVNDFTCLMSLTDEEVLDIGYVRKALPKPRQIYSKKNERNKIDHV